MTPRRHYRNGSIYQCLGSDESRTHLVMVVPPIGRTAEPARWFTRPCAGIPGFVYVVLVGHILDVQAFTAITPHLDLHGITPSSHLRDTLALVSIGSWSPGYATMHAAELNSMYSAQQWSAFYREITGERACAYQPQIPTHANAEMFALFARG